jgi:hypothetical protein
VKPLFYLIAKAGRKVQDTVPRYLPLPHKGPFHEEDSEAIIGAGERIR